MGNIIRYEDLLPFGSLYDGCLYLEGKIVIKGKPSASMECIKVSSLSYYKGESAPKISFSLTVDGQNKPLYLSHSYRMGKENESAMQSWRVPPAFLPDMAFSICIDVPKGTVLCVKNFAADNEADFYKWSACGPRYNAHLGFYGIAPNNTAPAFELAAACGFSSCICVPKWTKDNVLVCIHDDTINKTARDKDANKLEEPVLV